MKRFLIQTILAAAFILMISFPAREVFASQAADIHTNQDEINTIFDDLQEDLEKLLDACGKEAALDQQWHETAREHEWENEEGVFYYFTEEYQAMLEETKEQLENTDPDSVEYEILRAKLQELQKLSQEYEAYISSKNSLRDEVKDAFEKLQQDLADLNSRLEWPFMDTDFNTDLLGEIYSANAEAYEKYDSGENDADAFYQEIKENIQDVLTKGRVRMAYLDDYVIITLHANKEDAGFLSTDYYTEHPELREYSLVNYDPDTGKAEAIYYLIRENQSIPVFDDQMFFRCESGTRVYPGGPYYTVGWADSPTASVPDLVIGNNDPVGNHRELYAVWKKSLWSAAVELEYESAACDGTAKEPKVTVTYRDEVLREGVDYTVEYKNNIEASDPERGIYAWVYVYGKGDWVGSRNKKFEIHRFGADGYCEACGQFIFADVTGDKSKQYVSWAYENGIVKGTGENAFSPNDGCTRVQFAMMLWKMHGEPGVTGIDNPFIDVTGSKTIRAIKWALKEGVINSGKTFDTNGEITRVQIVMMLYKLAGSPKMTGTNPFSDISGNKTIQAVLWAYQNGITKGTGDGSTFSPNAACTRLQLVIFLYKYNGIYKLV